MLGDRVAVRAATASGSRMRRTHIPVIILAIALTASLYAWAVVAVTPLYPGAIGLDLNALGTDWMVFYGGARQVFAGHLARVYDGDAFTAYLNNTFSAWLSRPMPYRPFIYPPSYLLLVLPFGVLSFVASYIVFQAASAALLAAALWRATDRAKARGLVLGGALLGPAAAIDIGVGQNAFLVAALLVGGFRLLSLRPALAGVLLGTLTIKPQFWLLVPVALVAGREWRALGWAIAAAGALAAASALVLGLEPWRAWLDALGGDAAPGAKWIEYGRMWGVTVYACLAASGIPQAVANVGQAVTMVVAAGLTYAAYRRDGEADRKLAMLLAATVLAAPHVSLHDLVLLTIAAGLWIAAPVDRPRSLAEWTLALALVLAPLFGPPLVSAVARLLPLLILGFIMLVIAQAGETVGLTAFGLSRRPAVLRGRE
jgi:alpha-1,2-mannosyltransferase